jgi:fido (protein-threonine AMPylation protein)
LVPESFFSNYENEAELALCMVRSPSDLTKHLMDNGQPSKAEVLAGAYEFLKKNDFVEQIKADMALLAYTIRPKNPFIKTKPILGTTRVLSPAVARIEMLWAFHRESIIKNFPTPDPKKFTIEEVIQNIKEIYVHDAYNSLSIEGYSVTEELIKRISDGTFDTLSTEADKNEEAALAAKGYYLAFREVTRFIKENYGKTPSEIKLKQEIQNWYQQLFKPKVQAGMARPSLLVGYRNKPVFIRGSKHVPVNFSVVGEVMEKFLELLDNETSPEVRAVLGHFMLVFIHPFPDGNGRTSRFIMNACFILAGHNWTVIRNEKKAEYFKALEQASVHSKIQEFVEFIANERNISKAHSKARSISGINGSQNT